VIHATVRRYVCRFELLYVCSGILDDAGVAEIIGHCQPVTNKWKLEMWANAQPDGRPAEYR